MARFVFDTGMIVGYVRGASFTQFVDKKYQPLEPPNLSVISAVSKGEILSLAIQFGWGAQKKQILQEILAKLPAVDIRRTQIIERYAEIDSYSQGKYPNKPLPVSPRNMGKNDVWIAATASVLGAKLLTIDKDFDHLNGVFLDVLYIDQSFTAAHT
jgi:tRNA(fMet)-specific endonuclease VapC